MRLVIDQYSFRHLDQVASNNSGLENFRQFHHILAPPSSDPGGNWSRCKSDPGGCSATQIATLQG
ncbi:Pectin acetylesterase 9 [Zea mays]|nr:Pectin acetylesterase 9 [Zea mays]